MVEMQYGQNTTRWQSSLSTSWWEAETEAGGVAEVNVKVDVVGAVGGVMVVGLSVGRIPLGQVNIWMK